MENEPPTSSTGGPGRDSLYFGGASFQVGGNVYVGGGATEELNQQRPAANPTTNFPQAGRGHNHTFVGRVAQLQKLHAALTTPPGAGQHSAAAITQGFSGEGGIGKSQLAQRYAEQYAEHWVRRWWIDCAQTLADDATGKPRPSLAAHRKALEDLAALLRVTLPREQPIEGDASGELSRRVWFKAARGAIQTALSDGRAHLVILDNVERSDSPGDPWDVVKELTPAAPACVILTTRDQKFPASLATLVRLDVLTAKDARDLFRKRFVNRADQTGKTAPVFADADLDALTTHLGGHALAVDLAAACLFLNEGLTPEALLAKLAASDEATLGFLDDPDLNEQAHGYRLSVAKTLTLHVAALGDGPALRLLHAAAFAAPNDIPLELLAKTAGVEAGAAPMALGELVARSLVERESDGETTLVTIHRLMQVAVRARLNASGEAGANTMLESWLTTLIELFADTKWNHLAPRRTAARAHVDAVVAFVENVRRTGSLAKDAARLRADVAEHLLLIGQLGSAIALIDAAIAWGEAQLSRDGQCQAIWYASRARILQHRGDLAGAASDIEKSIAWEEAQAQPNQRQLAIRYVMRASILQHRGDLAGAEADIEKSIAWEEAQAQPDQRAMAIRCALRAGIRQDRGDLAGAEADIARSIAWGEAQSPRDERGLAICYASRARSRHQRGDLAGAEADIARSIAWGEAQSPRDERLLAIWYDSRAGTRRLRGDIVGAEADIQRSIAWGEAQSPRDERSMAIWYASRARILQQRGHLAGAEADIQRSIAWGEAQSPRDERSLAIDYASRANILQALGNLAGAEADIAKSIAWWEAHSPRDERSLANHYASRANIRRVLGDLAGAEGDIAKSIAWWEAQSPRDERGLAIGYASRARIRRDLQQFAAARADIDAALAWFLDNLSGDTRNIGIFQEIRDSIAAAERSG